MLSWIFFTLALAALSVLGAAVPDLEARANANVKTKALATHNKYRKQFGAKALTWADNLVADTQKYANKCKFVHSGGKFGENLAAGSGNYGIVNAIDGWMSEQKKYNFDKPGFSLATGHFTQVVWKGTTKVACALAHCKAGTIFPTLASNFVVCRYLAPGNVRGQFPQNVGRKK